MSDTVIIEFNGESHETTTAGAGKLLRRLKARARKAESVRKEEYDRAERHAAVAYRFVVDSVCAVLDDNSTRFLRVCRPDGNSDWNRDTYNRTVRRGDHRHVILRPETSYGTAQTQVCFLHVPAVLVNGAGYIAAALFTDPESESAPDYWAALGVAGDRVSILPLPSRIGKMIDAADMALIARKEEREASQA